MFTIAVCDCYDSSADWSILVSTSISSSFRKRNLRHWSVDRKGTAKKTREYPRGYRYTPGTRYPVPGTRTQGEEQKSGVVADEYSKTIALVTSALWTLCVTTTRDVETVCETISAAA
jgi:hypothetical protein